MEDLRRRPGGEHPVGLREQRREHAAAQQHRAEDEGDHGAGRGDGGRPQPARGERAGRGEGGAEQVGAGAQQRHQHRGDRHLDQRGGEDAGEHHGQGDPAATQDPGQ